MINQIVYGAIGFLLGGIVSGIVVGNSVAKDFRKRIAEQDEMERKLREEIIKLRSEKNEKRQKAIEKAEKEDAKREYNSLRKRYLSRELEPDPEPEEDPESEEDEDEEFIIDDDDAEDEDEDEDEDSKSSVSKIRMISEQLYNDELNYRDHEELKYYQEDGTLCDANNDILENEEDFVGSDVMDIIDETDNDFLYVSNDELDRLFEISVEHNGSYVRDVLGLG